MARPYGVILDSSGNLYVADPQLNVVFRRTPAGVVTVAVGTGQASFSGDGGQAALATLSGPTGLAFDSSANLLYIADSGNYRIRCVNLNTGVISTVAGNGVGWTYYPGDGNQATAIGIQPTYLAVSASSRLLFVQGERIVQVNADGTTTAVMGASSPYFNGLIAVAADSAGNIFAGTTSGIYKRSSAGVITQIVSAANVVSGYYSMAANSTLGMCWVKSYQIYCLSVVGNPYLFAGGGMGLGGDGGVATAASFYNISEIAFDSTGNLYIADTSNNRIRMVNGAGIVSTVMKGAIQVSPSTPRSVAADSLGNVFVADDSAHAVWKITSSGSSSLFAGTGTWGAAPDGGLATDSSLGAPYSVAAGANGKVYISDTGTHQVRVVDSQGILRTVAGSGSAGFAGDGGQASAARLNTPMGIALDAAGNVYIADTYNNRIRRVSPSGIITTIAGGGPGSGFNSSPSGGDGGPALAAQLNNPTAVAVDSSGYVYVSESSYIRRFKPGGVITTIAGNGGCGFSSDGIDALSARFCYPGAILVDTAGNLFLPDGANRVRRIDTSGIVTTVAGTGVAGYSGDGGPAVSAQLFAPAGVAMDSAGTVFVADMGNKAVRSITGGSRCSLAVSNGPLLFDGGPAGGSLTLTTAAGCQYTAAATASWIHVTSGATGTGSGFMGYGLDTNVGAAARSGSIVITLAGANVIVPVYQSGATCQITLTPTIYSAAGAGDSPSFQVTQLPTSCAAWSAASNSSWITVPIADVFVGASATSYNVAPNPGVSRTGVITVGGQTLTVTQAAGPVSIVTPAPGSTLAGSAVNFSWTSSVSTSPYRYEVSTSPGAADLATGATSATSVSIHGLPTDGRTLYFRLWYTYGSSSRVLDATVTAASPSSAGSSTPLVFYPTTPCRVADTRSDQGKTGLFGPPLLAAYSTRDFPISGSCGVPSTAQAFSLNMTVHPVTGLDWLSAYPAGDVYPGVSVLNAPGGGYIANAALVPAGVGGGVSVVGGQPTDLIIDVNGYFAPQQTSGLAFYPITPCRLADTRSDQGKTGAFGPPALQGYASRNFPIRSGGCPIPATAQAYALNLTAFPHGRLSFLSMWPQGQNYPGASTLNSEDGSVIANAAIVPAGDSGGVTIVTGEAADLIIDVNGYFAPPATGGLNFYALTPCRVADTRPEQGKTGAFGPPRLEAYSQRDFPIQASACNVPTTAQAYSLNVTVIPPGPVDFLSMWPAGGSYPGASTLNAPAGRMIANAAIVPAGNNNGGVTVVTGKPTHVVIDINGYFAP